jgi:hypothetical protein
MSSIAAKFRPNKLDELGIMPTIKTVGFAAH